MLGGKQAFIASLFTENKWSFTYKNIIIILIKILTIIIVIIIIIITIIIIIIITIIIIIIIITIIIIIIKLLLLLLLLLIIIIITFIIIIIVNIIIIYKNNSNNSNNNNNNKWCLYKRSMVFISELRRRITVVTSNFRETSFLFQKLSIALQWLNSVCVIDTFAGVGAEWVKRWCWMSEVD